MKLDIRRAIEFLVPNAKWDFSIPNEGGEEDQYGEIRWSDERPKPSWDQIVSTCSSFEATDLQTMRENMVVFPVQFGKALNALGVLQTVIDFVENSNDPMLKWAFNKATEFRRTDPFVEAMIVDMGKTPEEADSLFILAATL